MYEKYFMTKDGFPWLVVVVLVGFVIYCILTGDYYENSCYTW